MNSNVRLAFSPKAELTSFETGLTFTDILFGFVIAELFVRLQNWPELPGFVRAQLIAATILLLGSWIGFRRSVNRPRYELKFFNLPLWRFVLDQVMIVLYFRIAVATPSDLAKLDTVAASTVADETLTSLALIFALYALWDVLGIAMAAATSGGKPKYPKIEDGSMRDGVAAKRDFPSLAITAVALAAFGAGALFVDTGALGQAEAQVVFGLAAALLVAYRFAKEIKNSIQRR
ncbi:MAG TPA: hypothetical protein VGW75_04060 [Solirubrobacteraceae bacterium]|jgi:hypothetical protein|nr:hypothetical protein [Solirubrobacteraceae bacterium]